MTIIGIDLGTTNSLVAYWNEGQAELIPNVLGESMTPSIVGLDDDGQIIVGELAKQRLQTHPDKTHANFKRYMGTEKIFSLGKNKYRAEELSALLLKSLKADAEALLGKSVSDAIISVPAYFSDVQRKATKAAGQLAKLNVKRMINEPTAAAIAYGIHQKQDDTTFLVLDIGGGTFDVSILEKFDGVMQINASSGDNRLGGEDFVDVLVAGFTSHFDLHIDTLNSRDLAMLRKSAEACKRELTDKHEACIQLQRKDDLLEMKITRKQFNDLSAGLLQRLRKPLERSINDAGIDIDEIDSVVLVGGSSRMPIIRSLASKMLGKLPLRNINPDEIIALGTAIQVGLIQDDVSLKEVVLTDVSPFTLGIGVENKNASSADDLLFSPIIERNSPVPISRSDVFYNVENMQQVICIKVYQGESRMVLENIKLGQLEVSIPKGPVGSEGVEVRFTYDIDGLLEVETHVISTGRTARKVIEGNPGLLTATEIAKRLASLSDLKIHPRDKLENAVLLARGKRIYEESLGDKRAYVAEVLQELESVFNRQDLNEIAESVEKIKLILDDLEQHSPLA